jgi:hypothetical protein
MPLYAEEKENELLTLEYAENETDKVPWIVKAAPLVSSDGTGNMLIIIL